MYWGCGCYIKLNIGNLYSYNFMHSKKLYRFMFMARAVYRNFAKGGGGGGEFGVWKKEGGGGSTPYTCYAGMLVSFWHAKCCLFFKVSVIYKF